MAIARNRPGRLLPAPDVAGHGVGVTAVVVLTVVLTGGLLTAALPRAVAEPRPTIASVEQAVAELEHEVENAAEAANEARARLEEVRRRLAVLGDRLETERLAYARVDAGLGELVSEVYRGGGLDIDVQVLFATDPTDFMSRLATVDQVATTQDALLRRTMAARTTLAATEAAVAGEQARAAGIEAEAQSHQRQADRALAQARALLLTLREEERRRLAEIARKARLAQLAKARAAAAAAVRERERARAAAARARERAADSGGNAGTGGPADAGGSGTAPEVHGSGRASDAVQAALSVVGHDYVAGGRGPDVFDCSGLTTWAWQRAGVSLVPYSYTQWDQTRRVGRSELRSGDLVFFFGSGAHHVGLYLGDGQMVHAANPSSGVIISAIDGSWYGDRLSGFGRVVG